MQVILPITTIEAEDHFDFHGAMILDMQPKDWLFWVVDEQEQLLLEGMNDADE